MYEKASEAELFTLLALGIAALLLGLIGLVLKPRSAADRSWRTPLVLACLLALVAGGAAVTGLPRYCWQPAGLLAVLWAGFAACRTAAFAATGAVVVRWLAHPRCHAAVLVAFGAAVISWQSYAISRDLERDMEASDDHLGSLRLPPPLEDHPTLCGVTDAGGKIPLLGLVPNAEGLETAADELTYLRKQNLDTKLIRQAAIDHTHNCHGWVFTGGKAWVRGRVVDQILRDNNYQVVSQPAPGDLTIYRDVTGTPSHTSLVRAVADTGEVLLESKWGKLGRYVHKIDDHPYSFDTYSYYRSSRPGHVLRLEKR